MVPTGIQEASRRAFRLTTGAVAINSNSSPLLRQKLS